MKEIFVSIIALIIAGFGVWYNNRTIKKVTQTNIDANITAKARIEWIQSVRKVTAELIVAYSKVITSISDIDITQKFECAQEKTALFILYFGPDEHDMEEKKETNLLDRKTNKGKNDLIVNFIESLYNDLHDYNSVYCDYVEADVSKMRCDLCEEQSEWNPLCSAFDDGFDGLENYCVEAKDRNNNKINEYIELKEKLPLDIKKLSEIIRIYAKIEWNRAKTGK